MKKNNIFDYKGFSIEYLESLCADKNVKKTCKKILYWPSEVYSFGECYRKYARFPKILPLNVYSDHGIGNPQVYEHEFVNNAFAMLVFCDEKAQAYKKLTDKPVYNITPPMILYRNIKNIKQEKNAKGTIVFPAHSIPEEECLFDVEKYVNDLNELPLDMYPICVSLHMHDINKGLHKKFIELGVPVYCAGNVFDHRYAERFYSYLKHFKYSSSNLIGSYTYYSLEMGIPFSYYGDSVKCINICNSNNPQKGEYAIEEGEAEKCLKGINKTITEKQYDLLNKYINKNNSISRLELNKLLWKAFFYYKKGGNNV